MTAYAQSLLARWRSADDRERLLQVVQPGLIGLIDGTISTLAPIFATAYIAGSRAALLVGLAAALGAAISMGLSEGLSDDGELTGRGSALARGLITGGATFAGGTFHALPSSSPTWARRWPSPTRWWRSSSWRSPGSVAATSLSRSRARWPR
jgi:hypothetical protein